MGALLTALDVNESAQDKLSTAIFEAEKLIMGLMNIYQKLPSNNNKKELLATTIAETTRMMLLKVRQELEMPTPAPAPAPVSTPTPAPPTTDDGQQYDIFIDGEFIQNASNYSEVLRVLELRFGAATLDDIVEEARVDITRQSPVNRVDVISGEVFVYGQKIRAYTIPKNYGKDLMFELFLLNYQLSVRGRVGSPRLYITSNTNLKTYGLIENTSRISFALFDFDSLEDFAYPNFITPSMQTIVEPKIIAQEIDKFIKQREQRNQQTQSTTSSSTAVTHTPPTPTPQPPPAATPPMPPITMPTPTAPPITDTHTGDTGFYDEENYETWSTTQLQTEIEDIRGALELFEPSEPEYQELSYRLDIIEQILENRN